MKPLKVVLMGTTDFAVPALDRLVEAGHQVLSVVCQPDRPNKRGNKISFLPVKKRALALGIPVFQPERIKTPEAVAHLKALEADVFVVAAYGQILSEEILSMPPMGSVNIHGSLLPEYRGAAPVHHAILDGKDESGVTIMKMDVGMDTGDMLSKARVPITEETTVGQLHDALAELGADLLLMTLQEMVEGSIVPEKQEEAKATYADKVDRDTGRIHWSRSTHEVLRQINGTDPFPGAYTTLDGLKIKCFSPKIQGDKAAGHPGQILKADIHSGLVVKTADGALAIGEIQMPGKKRMETKDYLRGNTLEIGRILGKA
ncbi:MAG: methionyl-tRNA formyltransferase [Eubacterium aggregans]|uniref:methionyl-tRNA formyltransferase n=1 Tax=Eubacterium aggregans TaxID=81409 RepID=UPI002B2214C4|nr:methionyl-tRNA formyltransferase [Eubacterium aggregans]MEA5073221.1 methionyl-tRNA formyltransferase [Eubacterium aggregans]